MYKLVAFEMLKDAGAFVFLNTLVAGTVMEGPHLRGVIAESRSGRELFEAKCFVDCTGYGDLCAYADAEYTEPNDHPVANSIGVGGVRMSVSPTDRDQASLAEVELRKRQLKAIDLFRKHIPGCENAFIARTSPSMTIRRGRCITCDYDITSADVEGGKHFEDDVFAYGFHDCAPKRIVRHGGSYGFPFSAMRVKGIENLLASGMLITSDWYAHMSTRNTVSCMAQGQASGTAAALCALSGISTRDLSDDVLRAALMEGGVHFEH